MARRKLEELNLVDNFLFGSLLNYSELGEKFAKVLLRIILGIEFETIRIVPQKVFYGSNTDKHGTQLDVYIESLILNDGKEDVEGVFDLEPDQNDKKKYVQNLPRRTRFYHAIIDTECLKSGTGYQDLKNVTVIMITTYDPFGMGRMVYTIKNKCEELETMEYEDGAKTLYLYTKGNPEGVSRELVELLHYMQDTIEEKACNEDLREIHKMISTVKQNKGVKLEYMKQFEREQVLIEEALEEERMKQFEREQVLIEEALEEERMKQFEREQVLIEEALEEERMKQFEREQVLIEEALEEERMKQFEREQVLIEEALEEERMKQSEREQVLIEEALEEERMKQFEREQVLIEEALEKERMKQSEREQVLIEEALEKERMKQSEREQVLIEEALEKERMKQSEREQVLIEEALEKERVKNNKLLEAALARVQAAEKELKQWKTVDCSVPIL